MINILVTVGTTPFNSLFQALDCCDIAKNIKLHCQIANGEYIPENFTCFRFSDDFKSQLAAADAVITHAGAGTVFEVLEMGKKSIVVANLERKDKHQLELVRYVSENNFALGVTALNDLSTKIKALVEYRPNPYQKKPFFLADELKQKILEIYELN